MYVVDMHREFRELKSQVECLENVGCILDSVLSAFGRDILRVPVCSSDPSASDRDAGSS